MQEENDKTPWLTIVLIALGAFAIGMGLSYVQSERHDPAMVEGLLWPDPTVVGPIQLIDQAGVPFTLERLRGHWSLVFFGFTHCPDVCPTTLEVMTRAHRELKKHAGYGGRGQLVFISVDPERDTPQVLREYVNYFDSELLGVSGSIDELTALTRDLGVLFMKVPQAGADYSIDHSAGVFFVDPELRLLSVMTPPHSVAAIVKRFDAVRAFIEAQR